MRREEEKIRKIAANYIYCPDNPLVKNGYVEITADGVRVVETGGQIREVAGMEFYGGLIVPDYVMKHKVRFRPGAKMLPLLEQCFAEGGSDFRQVAIVEGADLLQLLWCDSARIRLL